MNALVELIKRIGIFMLAAQAVIHFAPSQKYEKYMKLIVGIMILLQFLTPVYRIFTETEVDFGERILDMEQELQEGMLVEELVVTDSVTESVISSLEEEMKTKLNNVISGENYTVTGVRISMKAVDGEGKDGIRQYELGTVRVVVRASASAGSTDNMGKTGNIGKIQIQKIDVEIDGTDGKDGTGEEGQGRMTADGKEEIEERLRERFCQALGMDKENMEVSVYGTVQETDG